MTAAARRTRRLPGGARCGAPPRAGRGWTRVATDRSGPISDADGILARLEPRLPEAGISPAAVIDELAEAAGPGLIAMGSPRFYGLVIGGTYPAAMAADWLVSAWDQNPGSRQLTPSTAAVEEVAAGWLLELLGLPAGSGVGFVTGGTSANLSALIVARDAVLRDRGHDASRGIQNAPDDPLPRRATRSTRPSCSPGASPASEAR